MKLILETTRKNKRIEDLFFIFVLMKKYILIFLLAIFFNVTSFLSQGMESDDSFTIELGLPNSFVNKALIYIFEQSRLRRWAITESISSFYPFGCVAQRNDFVFEKNQAWNWFRKTPGWGRNCEVRLRKETTGVQTKTIRLRWTYPTVCLPGKNCDVDKNKFNEFQLLYLRLVIVVEN